MSKEEDHFTINPRTQNGYGMNDPYDKPKNWKVSSFKFHMSSKMYGINWLELSKWVRWHCNYESDIFVVSVSCVSELNGLSSVLCATSGSNCTWPSVVAAKEQNNIRCKKYNPNTGCFSVFLYNVSYT